MRPQIKAARKAIAACRERGDGVLDLGGLGLDDAALRELLPELIKLPPLKTLNLGLAGEVDSQSIGLTRGREKSKENALHSLPTELIEAHSQLIFLNLKHNQLAALPESIGGLARLQALALHDNQLAALPESIGGLAQLRTLSLDNNQLAALPESIGGLAQLQTLFLDGNPLTYPPPEIVRQGAQAIVTFLAGVRANSKPLHEAKVVLVGDPAHGKTALRSWLEHDRFIEPGESTRGGEVGFRDIDVGEAKGRINIWDFGGQDRYRPAQQPLFTPGALYLLVCKGR